MLQQPQIRLYWQAPKHASDPSNGSPPNLSELINIYSPLNHQKTYSFFMISGGIEVN